MNDQAMETVIQSLEIMGKGMAGVFVVIGIIAVAVYLMAGSKKKN